MARILIVDDEKNVRQTMRTALAHGGHDVVTAEDGASGLEAFGNGEGWDVVIVDHRMPGMEGKEVIKEIHRVNPDMVVIMATSFATRDLASEVVSAGAVDFLRKPFSTSMLRSAVSAVLNEDYSRTNSPNASTNESAANSELKRYGRAQQSGNHPRVTHYLNGFTYWPEPDGFVSESDTVPHGFELRRVFYVAVPGEEPERCIVGVAPHVRGQLRSASGEEFSQNNKVWDIVCQAALADYLWEEAGMPPKFLPLFELTIDQISVVLKMTGQSPVLTY